MGELRQLARGVPGAEWRRIIDVPAPGAGHDVTIPTQESRVWRLLGVSCLFTAAAVAGSRGIALQVLDATGTPLYMAEVPAPVTISQARTISWAAGVGIAYAGTVAAIVLPLPDPLYLFPGESIALVGHTNAGDTFTKVRAVMVETYNGAAIAERNLEQSIRDHAEAIYELTH